MTLLAGNINPMHTVSSTRTRTPLRAFFASTVLFSEPDPQKSRVWIQDYNCARAVEDIVFICIAYIPPRQPVAELKESQPNLAGEIVAAYLGGNGLTPQFG